jgi:hypothetical protein
MGQLYPSKSHVVVLPQLLECDLTGNRITAEAVQSARPKSGTEVGAQFDRHLSNMSICRTGGNFNQHLARSFCFVLGNGSVSDFSRSGNLLLM